MPKKIGVVLVLLGVVLLSAALLLLLSNKAEDAEAGAAAQGVMDQLMGEIVRGEEGPYEGPYEVVEIDGYGYIGYLEIPKLKLTLPVMDEWDYERLEIAPCLQFGGDKEASLVIAAHNYESHFGKLGELSPGDEVRFTDMGGVTKRYEVKETEKLKADEVSRVQDSGYDLVLYTCTYTGSSRVAVFCDRVD